MAIVNRTLDASQQREVFSAKAGAVATGATGIIAHVPYPGVVEAGQLAAFGLSGSPTYAVTINRFIVGAGATAIVIAAGSSNAAKAFGTSGPTDLVMEAAGSTLLNVLEGDVIMYTSGGSNAAATGLAVSLVIRPTQDIKKVFGV